MNFYKAWEYAKQGYGMRKQSWPPEQHLVYMQGPDIRHGGAFMMYNEPGKEWLPDPTNDLLDPTWEVLNRADDTIIRD